MDEFSEKWYIEELSEIYYIINGISDNMMTYPNVNIGSRGAYFTYGQSLVALEGTLRTIDFCCKREYFSDAFLLTRKYRDDLMQYLYVSNIISNSKSCKETSERTKDEEAVESWMYNILDKKEMKSIRKKYFQTFKYKDKLNENKGVKDMFEKYFSEIWLKTDRTLNNHVHGNGLKYIYRNGFSIYDEDEAKKELISTIQDITSLFLAFISMTEARMLQASDFRDAMECNIIPEQGSERRVMGVVLGYMYEKFPEIDQNLLNYIQSYNSDGMIFVE